MRILPQGPENAALMILTDMPDAGDLLTGTLLGGEPGAMLDRMLDALGRSRIECRTASITLTRPPGGMWPAMDETALRALALHHISIARPQHVLILGQLACRLLTGTDISADGSRQPKINHDGATMAVTAIHHPRIMLDRPALKRGAWAALQRLKENG